MSQEFGSSRKIYDGPPLLSLPREITKQVLPILKSFRESNQGFRLVVGHDTSLEATVLRFRQPNLANVLIFQQHSQEQYPVEAIVWARENDQPFRMSVRGSGNPDVLNRLAQVVGYNDPNLRNLYFEIADFGARDGAIEAIFPGHFRVPDAPSGPYYGINRAPINTPTSVAA